MLLRFAAQRAPAGIACEFGVFQGHSLREIRDVRPAPVFGFDSWRGLPARWDLGASARDAGHFACEPPRDLATGVHLVPGWFADTIPAWLAENAGPVRFLHVDSDLYESARTVLMLLDGRIEPGTVIVFDELLDDGQYPNWREGEWRALCEWLAACGRVVEPIGRTAGQQAAFVVKG